jgi:hypothetical protein
LKVADPINIELKKESRKWWESRRLRYNLGLVIAGILTFIVTEFVSYRFIAPYDRSFNPAPLFVIIPQGLGYLCMMGVANVMYILGYVIDVRYNITGKDSFRKRLFNFGFWFSVGLPFIIPLSLFVEYLLSYSHLNH